MSKKNKLDVVKRVLVPIITNSEEIETVTVVDILRRANCDVKIASLENELTVKCSRNVSIVADCLMKDVCDQEFDAIYVPGGSGSFQMGESDLLKQTLNRLINEKKIIAAMCAAPFAVLHKLKYLENCSPESICAHTSVADGLSTLYNPDMNVLCQVETDSNGVKFITSRGPGTAMNQGLFLVRELFSVEKMEKVMTPMIFKL